MRVVVTGASSKLGASVLIQFAEEWGEVWSGRHRASPSFGREFPLDLEGEIDLSPVPAPIDLAVHFAAVTHARDASRYRRVNLEGSLRFVRAVRERGCRKLVLMSTRCATPGSGAYGESKLALERAVGGMEWDGLLVLRPSEVFGSGREGIDALLELARRWHVVPWLLGGVELSPLSLGELSRRAADELRRPLEGHRVVELHGPRSVSGTSLAFSIARRFKAIPVPIPLPVLSLAARLGVGAPDQVQRLRARKTASGAPVNAGSYPPWPDLISS